MGAAGNCSVCWLILIRGLIDVVVVYKVDRLTRIAEPISPRWVEVFDARPGCLFVAVTQQFNTTTSMGRLDAHTSCLFVSAQFSNVR